MKTKAYLDLFKKSLDDGKIPQDLYDLMVGEIAANDGKMSKRLYNLYLDELERRRLFDVDSTPHIDESNGAKTDGTYVYKRPKNPFWHIAHAFWGSIFKFLGWFGSGFVYGVWRIKDRKKIKKVGACIAISNHVDYFDSVLSRRSFGCKKHYIVAAPYNCPNNFGGHILRSATMLPLPISYNGTKPFNEMLEYVRDRGGALHFYAESVMWVHYKKPRPLKDGAFFYADKLDVPVVPILYCFKEPRGLRKLLGLVKVRVKIADPIYPDKSLSPRARQVDLAKRTTDAMKQMYEEFYQVPLEFLPEKSNGQAAEVKQSVPTEAEAVE